MQRDQKRLPSKSICVWMVSVQQCPEVEKSASKKKRKYCIIATLHAKFNEKWRPFVIIYVHRTSSTQITGNIKLRKFCSELI